MPAITPKTMAIVTTGDKKEESEESTVSFGKPNGIITLPAHRKCINTS